MAFGEEAAAALNCMRMEKMAYRDYLPPEAVTAGSRLVSVSKGLWEDVRHTVVGLAKEEIPLESPYATVWWYSVLLAMEKDPGIFLELINYIRGHEAAFSANTLYFLFYQLKSKCFLDPGLGADADIKKSLHLYFKETVERFADEAETPLEWIPEEEREEGYVVVLTEQLLSVQHAPTKIALDRCKILMESMGKRVLLINTAEVLTKVGNIPFMEAKEGNYAAKMGQTQVWKGTEIPYFQCSGHMPNIREADHVLAAIRKAPPEYAVTIGGSSMVGNLLSRMLPVLAVGLGPSGLEYTMAQYQTLSRKVGREDLERLALLGYDESHVIESVFTSSLAPQTEKVTRDELGIPEGRFLIVVVGYRLDEEVTDEFLSMLEGAVRDDVHIGFIGPFRRYGEFAARHPGLEGHMSALGSCDDILARYEVCDLYVNPIRSGGGTSGVGALFMGVPVVTVAYGDVAVNAGEDFCVKDYQEMQGKILEYHEDKAYYGAMSEKAKKRAEALLDSETEFQRIVGEFCDRKRKSGKP